MVVDTAFNPPMLTGAPGRRRTRYVPPAESPPPTWAEILALHGEEQRRAIDAAFKSSLRPVVAEGREPRRRLTSDWVVRNPPGDALVYSVCNTTLPSHLHFRVSRNR